MRASMASHTDAEDGENPLLRSSFLQTSAGKSDAPSLDRSAHLRVTNARLAKLEKMYEELSMLEARARD